MFLSQMMAAFQFPDTTEGWIFEVIGIVASIFVFFSFFWSNEKITRIINIIGCVVFVVYAILIGSLSVMIMNGACIILHIVKLVQMHLRKQKAKKSADDGKSAETAKEEDSAETDGAE